MLSVLMAVWQCNLPQKLHREVENRREAQSDHEKLTIELEAYKDELHNAEKKHAAAVVHRTEVEGKLKALMKQLSEKEEHVKDLTNELSQRERELQRLRLRKPVLTESQGPPKIYSTSNILVQSYTRNSHVAGGAHLDAEDAYRCRFEKIHIEVQSHKKALDMSNQLRSEVEMELEKVKNHCKSRHASKHFPLVKDVTKP